MSSSTDKSDKGSSGGGLKGASYDSFIKGIKTYSDKSFNQLNTYKILSIVSLVFFVIIFISSIVWYADTPVKQRNNVQKSAFGLSIALSIILFLVYLLLLIHFDTESKENNLDDQRDAISNIYKGRASAVAGQQIENLGIKTLSR